MSHAKLDIALSKFAGFTDRRGGRAEIARLTAQAEEVLAQALPELVESALKVMKAQLNSHSVETQFRAAKVVLNLAQPFVKELAENANSGVIIIRHFS